MTDEEIMESIPGWCSRHIPAGLLMGADRPGPDSGGWDGGRSSLPTGAVKASDRADDAHCPACIAVKRAEVARREEERVWLLANSKMGWPALKR